MWQCQNCETFNEEESCCVCGMAKADSDRLQLRKMAEEAVKKKHFYDPMTSDEPKEINYGAIIGWIVIGLVMAAIIYFGQNGYF